MKKLLVISHSCLEPVNREIYRYLARQCALDIHLVVPAFNDVGDGYRPCPEVKDEPFPVSVLRPIGRHLRFRRFQGLPRLIRKVQPSHIYVEADPSTWLVTEVLWTVRRRPISVWTLTGENLKRNYLGEALTALLQAKLKSFIGMLTAWGFLQVARRGISQVFTVSNDGTRVMESMGFGGRAVQIPLGFDPKLFFPYDSNRIAAIRTSLGLHEKTIAYFGRLSEEKGIHILLNALAQLKDLSWQFLMDEFTHEESPYVQRIKRLLADLNLSERVVFFHAKHDEMPRFMNAVDVAVLPSISNPKWREQYGRVVPEAMACGKLVVGSTSGALPEIIGDRGFIFPEGDSQALAQALRKLLVTPAEELERRGRAAAETAKEKFSLIPQARIWLDLIEST